MVYVLIDDDFLIRKSWEFSAKKSLIDFYSFKSVDEFFNSVTKFSPESTHVYIDYDLGDGLIGVNEGRRVFDHGFKKIYLATGHDPAALNIPNFFLGTQGKKPPF